MSKENNTGIIVLGIIVVVALVLFLSKDGTTLFGVTNQSESGDVSGDTNYNYYTDSSGQDKVDLAALLMPYYQASHASATCVAGGGTWYQQKDKVGCWGFTAGPIDCHTSVVTLATYQCQVVGGTATCTPSNVGCLY